MHVCERWLRNDFLVRHGYEPGAPCTHDPADCPPHPAPRRDAMAELRAATPDTPPTTSEDPDAT